MEQLKSADNRVLQEQLQQKVLFPSFLFCVLNFSLECLNGKYLICCTKTLYYLQSMEINDLQEKVLRLEAQLIPKTNISPEQCTQQEILDLKSKLQSKV